MMKTSERVLDPRPGLRFGVGSPQVWNHFFISGHIQIAASIHTKDVPALIRQCFHSIDGAIYQRKHSWIGPAIAVALRETVVVNIEAVVRRARGCA